MEKSNKINNNRNIDDTRDEVLNPDSEAVQTGRTNKNKVNPGSYDELGNKQETPHGADDRATMPLTNRKMEQDKKEREKELERVEKEKGDKQHKNDERQKEWGE